MLSENHCLGTDPPYNPQDSSYCGFCLEFLHNLYFPVAIILVVLSEIRDEILFQGYQVL